MFLLSRGNNIRDTPSLSPPIIIINRDTSAGLRLVQVDHVTRIISSDWSTSHHGSTVWEISMLAKIPAYCILHLLGFMGLIYAGAAYPLVAACFCISHCKHQLHFVWEKNTKWQNITNMWTKPYLLSNGLLRCCGFWQVNLTISISIYSSLPEAKFNDVLDSRSLS